MFYVNRSIQVDFCFIVSDKSSYFHISLLNLVLFDKFHATHRGLCVSKINFLGHIFKCLMSQSTQFYKQFTVLLCVLFIKTDHNFLSLVRLRSCSFIFRTLKLTKQAYSQTTTNALFCWWNFIIILRWLLSWFSLNFLHYNSDGR
jgi:hypothetical protein